MSDHAVFVLPLEASLGMDERVPLVSIVHHSKKQVFPKWW